MRENVGTALINALLLNVFFACLRCVLCGLRSRYGIRSRAVVSAGTRKTRDTAVSRANHRPDCEHTGIGNAPFYFLIHLFLFPFLQLIRPRRGKTVPGTLHLVHSLSINIVAVSRYPPLMSARNKNGFYLEPFCIKMDFI